MLTLIAGILTFSGFSGNTRLVIDQRAPKTEVGLGAIRKAGKRAISYRDALGYLNIDQATCFQLNWKTALLSFDNLVQVKLNRISLQPPFWSSTFCGRLTRMIPQNTDEEKPFTS